MIRALRRGAPALAAGALLLGLALTGCAPSGSSGVASQGGGSPTGTTEPDAGTAQGDGVKFAACMREHGVDVPDPEQAGGPGQDSGGVRFGVPKDADQAAVQEAMDACRQHLPNGGEPPRLDPEELAQAREFSACMREHGIEDFPDPNPDGGIVVEGDAIDVDDEFRAAQEACAEHLPIRDEVPGQSTGGETP